MKKVVSLLMVLMMIFAATSCGKKKNQHPVPPSSSSSSSSPSSPSDDSDLKVPVVEAPSDEGSEEKDESGESDETSSSGPSFKALSGDTTLVTENNGSVLLKSYALGKDYSDDDVIILEVVYTNDNSRNQNLTYYNAISEMNIYQNGVEISNIATKYSKDEASWVKPGYSLDVVGAFKLRDTTTDVVFECVDSDRNVIDSYTLKIS